MPNRWNRTWWISEPRRILNAVCAIAVLIPAVLYFFDEQYCYKAEARVQDFLATNPLARRAERHPDLVFLGIDKASIELDALFPDELERSATLTLMKRGYPFDRKVYADVLDRLVGAGAKAVVLDILFKAPKESDPSLRAALERHADQAVIGGNLLDINRFADVATTSLMPTYELPSATLLPEESISDRRVGFVNVIPDPGNVVRTIQYRAKLSEFSRQRGVTDPELLSLASRALEKYGAPERIPSTRSPVRLRFADDLRTKPLFEMFVEDIWKAPPYNSGEFFRGKIVLVGASGNESEDRLVTPFGTVLGPSIHFSAINAALQNDFLKDLPAWAKLAVIVAGGVVAWFLARSVHRTVLRLVLIGGAGLGYFALAQVAFNTIGLYPLILSPILALTTSSVTWIAVEQILESREKNRIRRTFERYVSKDVVQEVLDNRESFLNTLGGQRRPVTVLFSDVRGFTTATESADPQQLVSQLNEYFSSMVHIVRVETRGTLDKFIGDAVMAHWGSIVTRGPEADACSAVSAALSMRKELARLNESWEKRGLLRFNIGIGINQGEVVVGNIGSEERAEVSVIGDAVNLASRLEGVTKPYHIDLCVGETVAALVKDAFLLRSLDLIKVKGKTKPVEVFTILERNAKVGAEPEWLSTHEEAMRHYRAGRFQDAERCWREVLAKSPEDGVAALFVERCQVLQVKPPPQPWTGVFEMTSK